MFNPGEVLLNKYEISNLIGEGAFGGVYKARDIKLDRTVAVKVIRSSQGSLDNFAAEIEAVKRLEHPNIARLYDYDLIRGGTPCLVMEYVDGRELGDILSTDGTFSYERLGNVGCQVLDALVETHHRGIVHCDLKPENIMLTSKGARTDVVKLIDFGVASLLTQINTDSPKDKALVGTPQYMSPEQIRRETIGPWTDIYAVGLILIELWTGSIVFDNEDPREVLKKQLYTPVPIPKELAATALGKVIEKAVQKDPTKRYQDTLPFYNDLKNAIDTMKSEAHWQLQERSHSVSRVARERACPSIFKELHDTDSGFGDLMNLDVSFDGRRRSTSISEIPLLNALSRPDSDSIRRSAPANPFDIFETGRDFESYDSVIGVPKAGLAVPKPTPGGAAGSVKLLSSEKKEKAPAVEKQEHIPAMDVPRLMVPELKSRRASETAAKPVEAEPKKKPSEEVDFGNLNESLEGLENLSKGAIAESLKSDRYGGSLVREKEVSVSSSVSASDDLALTRVPSLEKALLDKTSPSSILVPRSNPKMSATPRSNPSLSTTPRSNPSLSTTGSSFSTSFSSTPSAQPVKGKGISGGVVVVVLILVLILGALAVYFMGGSGDMHRNVVTTNDSPTNEVPMPVPVVRRATIVDASEKMAQVALQAAVKGATYTAEGIKSFDIIGTPVTAGIYIEDRRVCTSTPCTIHVYGALDKVDVEIRTQGSEHVKGKSGKKRLSSHKDSRTPIVLSVR